jgi:hypothetical protein
VGKNNSDMVIRLKLFLAFFLILLVFSVILTGIDDVNWILILIISLISSVDISRYKKTKIEILVDDKASFIELFKDCLEHIGLKITSESNEIFIIKPKFNWLDRFVYKEDISITVDESQAILIGPSVYVEKINRMLKAFL